jgi:hypothetical protein
LALNFANQKEGDMNIDNHEFYKICNFIIEALKSSFTISGVSVGGIQILTRQNRKKWTCYTCGKIMPKGNKRIVLSAKTRLMSPGKYPRLKDVKEYSLSFCCEEHCRDFISSL